MGSKTLFLGLHPQHYPYPVVHMPLIYPKIRHDVIEQLDDLDQYPYIILTSQTAVQFFFQLIVPQKLSTTFIAVGPMTQEAIRAYTDLPIITAALFSAKGIVELLSLLPKKKCLYLHSARSACTIIDGCKALKISLKNVILYDVEYCKPNINPSDFEEIVFTSPSIVELFFSYLQLSTQRCIAIGETTAQALRRYAIEPVIYFWPQHSFFF